MSQSTEVSEVVKENTEVDERREQEDLDESVSPDFLEALRKLGLIPAPKQPPPPVEERILPEPSLERVCEAIQSGKCAGMSCAAGIPDFRTPGTGLYDNLQKYDLPTPESIFTLEHTPEPFYSLAKELYPGNFKPTPAHYFIRLLDEKGLLLRNYSQNIDTLERLAGIPVIEAHGSFSKAHCLECKKEYSPNDIKQCEDCGGLIKPDIVFFGEGLPEHFFKQQLLDFPRCDLLLVMGTSLKVYPFAGLISKVSKDTPRVLINMVKAGDFERDPEFNYRDIMALGDLQETTWKIVKMLGWEDDFTALLEREGVKL